MLTRLPKPTRLIYCRHCDDIVVLDPDCKGNYCIDCGYRIAVKE